MLRCGGGVMLGQRRPCRHSQSSPLCCKCCALPAERTLHREMQQGTQGMVTLLLETMDMGCRPAWPSHHGMQDEGAVSSTACNTSGVCSLQGVTKLWVIAE